MNGIDREKAEAARIEREFPGWAAWVGIDSLWHARQTGMPVSPDNLVTGEDDVDLRDQIRGRIEWQS